MMWTTKNKNELYVWRNGELVYKRWVSKQPSLLYNTNGWPNEWIT